MRNLRVNCVESIVAIVGSVSPQSCRLSVDELSRTVYVLTDNCVKSLTQENQKDVLSADFLGVEMEQFPDSLPSRIAGMQFLADQQYLCVATTDGKLVVYEAFTEQHNIVADLEDCFLAMSWSPDLELAAIVTGSDTLFLLNRDFEVVFQTEAMPDSFGQDELITVGWGKKETQFHGSEGKQAAKEKSKEKGNLALSDDLAVHISWSGDGQFFAVSSVHNEVRRIRVWTREGVHSSTTEPLDGLESCLDWKPSGNLIASAQKRNKEYLVIFFERNGLRHGEFALTHQPLDAVLIRKLAWNLDSTVLLVVLEVVVDGWDSGPKGSCIVEFWTTRNYHWYKKLSMKFAEAGLGLVNDCRWDGEQPLKLHLVTQAGGYLVVRLDWVYSRSLCRQPGDPAMCAVIDGDNVLLTPFRDVIIPPPMSLHKVAVDQPVNQVSFQADSEGCKFFCVQADGKLSGYCFEEKDKAANHVNFKIYPRKCFSSTIPCSPKSFPTHLFWLNKERMVFVESGVGSALVEMKLQESNGTAMLQRKRELQLENSVREVIISSDKSLAMLFVDGSASEVDLEKFEMNPTESFSHGTGRTEVIFATPGESVTLVLNEKFQLFIDDTKISDNVGSFCCNDQFLLVCTLKHRLYCLPFSKLKETTSLQQWESSSRTVERGSELVVAVPGDTKVVFQLPRGNLEIIHPRPLILNALKHKLKQLEYKKAIVMMKKHRINMNLLYDFDPELFMANVELFVRDVDNVDLLNLFLAEISNDDVTTTLYSGSFPKDETSENSAEAIESPSTPDDCKVNKLCRRVREVLDSLEKDEEYLTAITLTFVRTQPCDTESALHRIKKFRDKQGSSGDAQCTSRMVDAALTHLLCLTDIDRLFDCALGTYDFDLVLMVAQKSQKDPKEYLPFLNDLRILEINYMKYRIDCHLKRHVKAIVHISQCGSEHFEECLQLIEKHQLYTDGLRLYSEASDEFKKISLSYANHLLSQRRPCEAGLIYDSMKEYPDAIRAFTQATEWQLALNVALKSCMSAHDLDQLAQSLAEKLKSQAKYFAAARVFTDWCKNETAAIDALIEGQFWQDADLLIMREKQPSIITDKLLPALMAASTSTVETLNQKQDMFKKHRDRLVAVRRIKQDRYNVWKNSGGTFDDLEACETYSEVSTVSRVSTKSRGSKLSGVSVNERQRRRAERKRISLKVGSPYEDAALLQELTDIVTYMDQSKDAVRSLALALKIHNCSAEALSVQDALAQLEDVVQKSMLSIYPNKIEMYHLPGPMHDYIICDSDVDVILAGGLPSSIKIDPLLLVPKLRNMSHWKLA